MPDSSSHPGQRPDDRHRRPLDRREPAERYVDVDVQPEAGQRAAGCFCLPPPADDLGSADSLVTTAECDVVHCAELEDQSEILMDEADAQSQVSRHRAQREGCPVQRGLGAVLRLVIAGQDLDERRLARAVLADQTMDLAGPDVEIDTVQRGAPEELLRDVTQAEPSVRGIDPRVHGLVDCHALPHSFAYLLCRLTTSEKGTEVGALDLFTNQKFWVAFSSGTTD